MVPAAGRRDTDRVLIFATPPPVPSTPSDPSAFIIAIIALLLSGLSAAAAVAALGLTLYLHPKPYLIPRIRRDDPRDFDRPTFLFSLVDSGGAPAKDVSLVLRSALKGQFEQVWSLIELPLGTPQETRVSMVTGTTKTGWERDEFGDLIKPKGWAADMLIEFEVTWRQSPNMEKQRRAAYWVEVEDGNVFIAKAPKKSGWVGMGRRVGTSREPAPGESATP
jgi:hypothetical protein